MATRIRLKRTGAKHDPHFRVVIVDQHKPRDGRTIEEIGHYDPGTDPPTVVMDRERALHWLSVGAVPSDTVRHLLKRAGVVGAEEAASAPPEAAPAPEVEAAPETEAAPDAQ